jgi:hypothetical protein
MRPSMNEWHDFTRIWVENVRHLKRDSHHCRLAIAMAASDNQRHPWDHYLTLAMECFAFQEEMANPVLQRRKAAYEALGWTFTFTGHGWRVQAQSLDTSAKSLAVALRAIEEWGQPLRESWGERHLAATKQALHTAQAIQQDVKAIMEGAQ